MKHNNAYFIFFAAAIITIIIMGAAHVVHVVIAEENESVSNTTNTTESQDLSKSLDEANESADKGADELDIGQKADKTGQSELSEQPEALIPEERILEVADFEIINITPKQAEEGDVLLAISVKNTGNVKLEDIIPIVVARGFSTYDTIPIKALGPNATAAAFVSGNLNEAGSMVLTIKIDDKIFYDKIDVEEKTGAFSPEEQAKEEARKKASLDALKKQESELKKKYKKLEEELNAKKKSYDISNINLDTLKSYMLAAQTGIISEDVQKANVSIIMGFNEYSEQLNELENAVKKPIFQKIRENLLLISGLAAAIVTLFTFYELMRKKKDTIYTKVKEIKITEKAGGVIKKIKKIKSSAKSIGRAGKKGGKKDKRRSGKESKKKEEDKKEDKNSGERSSINNNQNDNAGNGSKKETEEKPANA